MQFHGVDVKTQFKRMRELVPETYKAFLEFDQKAFKGRRHPGKTRELHRPRHRPDHPVPLVHRRAHEEGRDGRRLGRRRSPRRPSSRWR